MLVCYIMSGVATSPPLCSTLKSAAPWHERKYFLWPHHSQNQPLDTSAVCAEVTLTAVPSRHQITPFCGLHGVTVYDVESTSPRRKALVASMIDTICLCMYPVVPLWCKHVCLTPSWPCRTMSPWASTIQLLCFVSSLILLMAWAKCRYV